MPPMAPAHRYDRFCANLPYGPKCEPADAHAVLASAVGKSLTVRRPLYIFQWLSSYVRCQGPSNNYPSPAARAAGFASR